MVFTRIFSRVQRSHACKGETHFYPCKGEPTDFHACKGEPASFYACKGESANFHACKGRVQRSRAKVVYTQTFVCVFSKKFLES